MKTVLLALLIFSVNSIIFAQSDLNLISQNNYSKVNSLFAQPALPMKTEWHPPGYRMRRVGATLTLAGTFLVVGGVVVQNNSSLGIGPLMMAGGTGMIIPGVIFWTKGAVKYKIYQAEQTNTASLHFMGNGIAYRF